MTSQTILKPSCEVSTREDAIYADKGNGTQVYYHIFDEYEVHANVIAGGGEQEWHHHLLIIETICVTAGELVAFWQKSDGNIDQATLRKGDVFDVGGTVHTFRNESLEPCEFLVFRLVPTGVDKRELIKADRYADSPASE
jgi:hypothetical protein